jgi:hypothetical protein
LEKTTLHTGHILKTNKPDSTLKITQGFAEYMPFIIDKGCSGETIC